MDLYISITDENGDVLQDVNIYCDGSDSEGADNIVKMVTDAYVDKYADDVANEDEYWLVAYTWRTVYGATVHSNDVITISPYDWLVNVVTASPAEKYVMLNAMKLSKEQAEKLKDICG